MKSPDCITHSREPMLSASTRTIPSARLERMQGKGITTKAAVGEDFADVVSLVEDATDASESSATVLASDKAKAEGVGLMAVLEKLAARSLLRPEVRGLQNAANRIRENLERRGYTVSSQPDAEDVYPIESIVTGDEQVEELQNAAGSDEGGARDITSPAPVSSSDALTETMVGPVFMTAENQTALANEEG